MTNSNFLIAYAFASLFSPIAFAGASSGYLCASDEPYDHFSVVERRGGSAIEFRLPGDTDAMPFAGRILAGQSPTLESRAGLMVVPLISAGAPVVDVYFKRNKVARLPGLLQDADIGGTFSQLALISTSKGNELGNDDVEVTQRVVAADGRVLASRKLVMGLNEDEAQQFRLTERGDGIYRLPSENAPSQVLEVLDVLSFRPRLSITAPRLVFTDVQMQSAHKGFAIGNGQLYRIANRKLEPTTRPEDGFVASRLEYDPRSNLVLAQGQGGFWLFDGQGKKLLGERGLSSVRLTIEGDVVKYDGSNGKAWIWHRDDAYAEPKAVSLDALENWNAIACMTSRSAAVLRRDSTGARGRLVFYGN